MLNVALLFATTLTEVAVARYSPTTSSEREQAEGVFQLVEIHQRNSKPFKIERGNIYTIAWNKDDCVSTHVAEAIEVVLESEETLSIKSESLGLQRASFIKMLLLGLIQLANEGCIESTRVLSGYVRNIRHNEYVENSGESCAYLSQLETYLRNQQRGLVQVTSPLVTDNTASNLIRCQLGDIYCRIYSETFHQNLPSQLEQFATDDMVLVELFQSKKVTPRIEKKMRTMREAGMLPWRISQEFGFSMATVLKYTNSKPRKDTWTGCLSAIFGSSADQTDREPLLADQHTKKDQ